ncbi:type IX secretion system plug protein [Flavobacterium sp.]|uniref:type IX secretion system plug protein n=1 Tax=Flavobacterium sp. TaxID=239 RepID=UPI002FDD16F1
MNKISYIICLLFCQIVLAQSGIEQEPPFNIKTISFVQNRNNVVPYFKLGEVFELQFDDLYGDESDYYYTITQYNYDWSQPTNLAKNEYLNGMDNQRIITYENSFNTLQLYSHYVQRFPNQYNQITKSGNYLITVLNDENEIVFSRRFIIYEELVNPKILIKRTRDFENRAGKHNIELSINYGNYLLQNPIENVKVTLIQNANWSNSISNIKPQYTLGTELIYRYNKETQFWGGNESYSIDNKIIRATNNTVAMVTSGENLYNTHLYVNKPRKNQIYTYFPDINGNFYIDNINTEKPAIQADYSWVYFSLDMPFAADKKVFINGMFNNYSLSDEYKMDFNKKTGLYEKALLLKQGFTNYQYVLTDKNGKIDYENAIDGNYFETDNLYSVLIYYQGNNERYHRVIGLSVTNSLNIQN